MLKMLNLRCTVPSRLLMLAICSIVPLTVCSMTTTTAGMKSAAAAVVIRRHTEAVTAVQLTPDGQRVISGGLDSQLGAYRLSDTDSEFIGEITHYDGVHDIELIPMGQITLIASCSRTRWPNTSGTLQVSTPDGKWNRRTGGTIACHFNATALSPAGLIAVGGNDNRLGNLRVFNLTLLDTNNKEKDGSLDACEIKPTTGSFPSAVTSLAFAPYAIVKGKKAQTPPIMLAVGCETGIIKLVTISEQGVVESPVEFKGYPADAKILGLGFTEDGQTLVTGGSDSTIRFWNVQTGKELSGKRITSSNVSSFRFEPKSGLITTGCSEGNIRVFSPNNGQQPALELSTGRGFSIRCMDMVLLSSGKKSNKKSAAVPQKWRLAVGDEDKAVTIWTIEE